MQVIKKKVRLSFFFFVSNFNLKNLTDTLKYLNVAISATLSKNFTQRIIKTNYSGDPICTNAPFIILNNNNQYFSRRSKTKKKIEVQIQSQKSFFFQFQRISASLKPSTR